jgi:hypothetical protein
VCSSLPEQGRRCRTVRNWLFGLSILAAACVFAWLLVARMDSPFSAACMLIAAIGWVLYQFAQASTPGVVLWCAAAVAISEAYWRPIDNEGLWEACVVLGGLLPLVGSLVFLHDAVTNRKRQAANCGGCVLALLTLITWIVAGSTIRDSRSRQESVQETTHALITLHKLANDIETIRASLGHLPKDEKELVRLRGKPMPLLGARHDPISYYRGSDLNYQLNFGLTSFWGYHSNYYVACFYGSNTTPRLFVDLF